MPRGNIKMLYYFCYGSPLMDRSLDRRVDSLRLEGQGRLDGYAMTFTREGARPNLQPEAGAKTWGCLYLIEEHKLADLDKEEAGGLRTLGKAAFEGRQEPCVYYTYAPQAGAAPSKEFLERLRSVYMQASLPQAQIDQALGLARA
jgi:gamma-glutamylcyclotransferase (GGCT)/AIG2-like uncharacterized protein YtfP